jgi:hypothetical protein
VHHHLRGGNRELHEWIKDFGIELALKLSGEQVGAIADLVERLDRNRYDLLREAVDDLLFKHRRTAGP